MIQIQVQAVYKNLTILTVLTCVVICLAILGGGVIERVTGVAAVMLCLSGIFIKDEAQCSRVSNLGRFIVVLVVVLVATVIPMPRSLISLMSPVSSEQNEMVVRVISESSGIGLTSGYQPSFSLSRNRGGTIRIIFLVIAGVAAGALSSRLTQAGKIRYIKNIVIIVTLLAAAGCISQWIFPQGKSIWWVFEVKHGHPVGCFVNRNHFGGFLAMLCPAAMALCVHSMSVKKRFSSLFWGAAFLIIAFATLLSLSRGAWLAALVAMAVTVPMICFSAGWKQTAILAGTLLTSAGIFMVAFQVNSELSGRVRSLAELTDTESAVMRMETWRDAIKILPDYPLTGVGANAFRMVFPRYRTSSSRKEFKHAENEYIQMPVEAGLIGTILLAGIAFCVFTGWRSSVLCMRDQGSSVVWIGVAGALVAAAIHACFDFAIRVPLYFITLVSLIGLVASRKAPTSAQSENSGLDSAVVLQGVAAVLCLAIFFAGGRDAERMDSPDFIKTADSVAVVRILTWSPSSWHAWYQLGNSAIQSGLPGSYEFGEKCITTAAKYNPLNYRLWERLARVRLHMGDTKGAMEAYNTLTLLRPWIKIDEMRKMQQNPSKNGN